ncbi:ABC transporter ATP-binding protein [Zavarzinia sp. CC-PAN008]|uniref:ABC transporter ATP-binding protein n=1 Tax=Zavarzinia sp. CC-PAN008 TaxID=3243332 RepID=UPI003F74A807
MQRDVAEAFVVFEGVQKTYDGEVLVVKDLDLTVRKGEFLTLLGPSGSGKTTTLMMLAGFETPTRGHIYLDSRPIDNLPPHKRDIGMVFQNYALFPHMTVSENIAFPLMVRKLPKAEIATKVEKVLDLVQLRGFGNRRPAQLSGGQQQRVALARALVFEPALILMDEPLGALDKQLRERMQIEIKHIHDRLGVTFVYVTHDQTEALTMSDRIAVFNDGVIQQLAGPDELYEAPVNAFVAQFIGENNRMHGQVVAIENGACTVRVGEATTVRATAVNVTSGGATTLSIRPERVVLQPAEGSVPNILEGRIDEVIYVGDHSRVRMHVPGCTEFDIKVPNSAGRPRYAAGAVVRIGFKAEDCRALDAP